MANKTIVDLETDLVKPYIDKVKNAYINNAKYNGAYNLALNRNVSGAGGGITWTNNGDGSWNLNGTATANPSSYSISSKDGNTMDADLTADDLGLDPDAEYFITLLGTSSASLTFRLYCFDSSGTQLSTISSGANGVTFKLSTDRPTAVKFSLRLAIGQGTTVDRTVYPLLCLKSDWDLIQEFSKFSMNNHALTEAVTKIQDNMAMGGGYIYPLRSYFYHIKIKTATSSGLAVKLVTGHGELFLQTSSGAFNNNQMVRQKVIANNSNDNFIWTYSIDGLTINLNCTGHLIGYIISNAPIEIETVDTSTPETNTLNQLNLALLSNT